MRKDESLITRFISNGHMSQLGMPEKENPPNEWYYIEPLLEKNKFRGIVLNIEYGSLPKSTEYLINLVPVRENPKRWLRYEIEYSPKMDEVIEVLQKVFSDLQYGVEKEPQTSLKQIALVNGFSTTSAYGLSGVSVVVTQQVRSWIANCTDSYKKQIKQTMLSAFKLLLPTWEVDIYEFGMWISYDRFGLSVPGNCACLGVDGMADTFNGLNYELIPHNNDCFGQQMALLAGIAKIWSLVRNELIS